MSRLVSVSVVTLLVSFSLLTGCECDRGGRARERSAAGEGEGTSDPTAGEGEGETREGDGAPAQPGPLGRTLAVFDDGTVTTRLFVLHRVGDADADAPADATVLGSAWIAGVERELTVTAEQATATGEGAAERSATLFGPIGACSARILRTVSLRGTADGQTPSRYDALEIAPCEGSSIESLETTYPFGVEGEVAVEQLLASTMSAATEAQREVVAEAEREAGDGEEMDLEAREIGDTHVAVLAGWQSYAVRDGAVLATYEDGIPAWVTIGARTYLVARDGRDVRLLSVGAAGLEPVVPEGAATEGGATGAGGADDETDESEP